MVLPDNMGTEILFPETCAMAAKPLFVLFLSTGNAARSILAEAIMNAKGSDRFTARSAGYQPLDTVHADTLRTLKSAGLPIQGVHTKGWGEFLAASSVLNVDVIITLSEEARINCPAWLGEPVRCHWTVDDPLGAERADVREWKFRKCFATLDARITALIRERAASTPGELFMQLKNIGMVV